MRIALLEDDMDQAALLQLWLKAADHTCEHFDSGEEFILGVKRESFDVLILDWLVPGMSGMEVLKWVRENIDWEIPILFATIMDREDDVVAALELGADDYMVKPLKEREILARLHAVTRRTMANKEDVVVLDFEPYHIDLENHKISKDGEPIELTQKEYELAVFMFKNIGKVLSRGHILVNVWGRNPNINTRTVDTHTSRIRTKLALVAVQGWKLSSIYQHGYRLERLEHN